MASSGIQIEGMHRGKHVVIGEVHRVDKRYFLDFRASWEGLVRRLHVRRDAQSITLDRHTKRPVRIHSSF